ncbi:DUF418 domain-containing protein [Nocardiopsis sp. FIRDI 009]|uniref:DUF418 domain-containing protein n=1 Tax=Nocardiopsis sp. FIRDI 009 TaxID=714197 RepID=UPI001E62A77E|nr:DUF418 domain-containing protein [Nocardiopsis sp. FIRDI 009]
MTDIHTRPEPQAPPAPRVAFLDVARALAMIGVVMMNVTVVVFAAERVGAVPVSTLTSVVDGTASLLMSGKARAMLMVLLGVGAVLAWRGAVRRGQRPMTVMARRYAVLGLLFGVPHLLVFDGDILTHYAITAIVLAPLMPVLLAGARRRPLVAAVLLFALAPGFELLMPTGGVWILVSLVPQTLAFFCVGVWLARRPELDPERRGEPSRLPVRMIWSGLAGQAVGLVAMFSADLLFPVRVDADGVPVHLGADGVPVTHPVSDALVSLGGSLSGIGGALFYLGLVWWLVGRGRGASRVLGAFAPLGRMTLTVYLGSTAVFLLTMSPFEGEIPLLGQYGVAAAYFAVTALGARWWMRRFRLGPLEWVWRSLTHLRPMPMRRVPADA